MSRFSKGKGKDEREAAEKARREQRRHEISAKLRGELTEGADSPKDEVKYGGSGPPAPEAESSSQETPTPRTRSAPRAGPAKAESAKAESAKAESAKAESAKAESAKAESPKAESPKAKSPKAKSPKAKSPKAKSPKAGSAKAKPAKREPREPSTGGRKKVPSVEGKAKGKKAEPRKKPERKPADRKAMEAAERKRKARRDERRKKVAARAVAARAAGAKGLRATGKRAEKGGSAAWKAIAAAGVALLPVLAFLVRAIGVAERGLKRAALATRRAVVKAVTFLDRVLTPARMAVVVTGACAVFLVISQYTDYRGVAVGQPQYVGVADIAPPPMVDVRQTADNHSVDLFGLQLSVMLPIALVAIALAVIALRRRLAALALLISVTGIASLAITFLVDRPTGLDEGDAGIAFAGARAELTDGYYAQLAASAGLVLCGLLLAMNLRPEKKRSTSRRRDAAKAKSTGRGSQPQPSRRKPSLAEDSP